MKVLMIGPAIADETNYGLGVASEQIAQYLSSNCVLTIVSPSLAQNIISQENEQRLEVNTSEGLSNQKGLNAEAVHIQIKSQIPTYVYGASSQTVSTLQQKVGSTNLQLELKEFSTAVVQKVKELDYDVIYAHDWLSIQAALALKDKFNKYLVLHIHSLDYDRTGKNTDSWLYKLEKEGMEKADRILAVSQYHSKIIQSQYGISKEKISVVPLALAPVKSAKFKSPFSEKIVLFSGRLSHQKGILKFVDIAEQLHESDKELRFIVAGAGELSEEVVSKVHEKGLTSYFNFTGRISQEELHGLMHQSDIFIMPSVSEPFGLVALEAASKALPIVISKNAGVLEVLKSSFVPKEENAESYVKQIKAVLNNKEKAAEAIKKNTSALKKRDWNDVGSEIIQVLKK